MTNYVVLQFDKESNSYHIVAREISARSTRGAIHSVVSQMSETPLAALLVAVPERHWQPMNVKVSMQTKLEIS